MDQLSDKFNPIFDILGELDSANLGEDSVEFGESIHVFLLGVDGRMAGRGVAQQLIKFCLDNGSQKGYKKAVTEATNKVSQHIFHKHGFAESASVSYKSHRFNGQAIFASIADQGGPKLMTLSLV